MMRREHAITTENETEVQFDEALFASLTNKQMSRIRLAFPVEKYGRANVCLSAKADWAFATVRINPLTLRTTIKTKDKIVTPSWEDKGDVVELLWLPPEDMTLVHCTELSARAASWRAIQWYLFAFYGGTDVYQLPLANLYSDCHICTGHTSLDGKSMAEVVEQGLTMFRQSQWNSHLIHENGMTAQSQELFRFESTVDGFITMGPKDHWTRYCKKIGIAQLQYVVL